MKKNKTSLLEELKDFLDFLQEEDSNPKKRQRIILKYSSERKNSDRIVELCLKSGYITEEIESFETYRISEKGLKFLEDYYKGKFQEDKDKTQMFLTLGLFSVALLQGLISGGYYFFDLILKGARLYANVLGVLTIIFISTIILSLIKISKKLIR